MSSSSSTYSDSDDSEVNYITNYEIEADPFSDINEDISTGPGPQPVAVSLLHSDSDDEEKSLLCADDPVADEEWTAQYEVIMREHLEEEEKLKARLDGTTEIDEW